MNIFAIILEFLKRIVNFVSFNRIQIELNVYGKGFFIFVAAGTILGRNPRNTRFSLSN